MPIKRRLTQEEIRARRRTGERVNPFQEHTFLTPEERALLRDSVDAGETVDEFLARITDHPDRDVLAKEQERMQSNRRATAQRRDRRAQMTQDGPVRQRQPVSPSNPYGAYLDPRHDDLPEYPRSGHAQQKRLREAATDYRDTAAVLERALEDVAGAFADAFAREDARTAVRDRINRASTDRIHEDHTRRLNRLG